jgi:dethiobiotin synthetase
MTARGIFLTGTDTGAGKTLVSCAILRALARRGVNVAAYKPVETGCSEQNGTLVGADCVLLSDACGAKQKPEDVAGYLFAAPAAPLVAAEAEGATIERDRLIERFHRAANGADFVLVESAGGLMVPLTGESTTRDLVRDLGLPVVCVVASRLGCINHALLTVQVLRNSGVVPAGFVMNEVCPDSEYALAIRTNREVIGRFADIPDLGSMPYVDPARRDDMDHLASLADTHLDLDAILAAG